MPNPREPVKQTCPDIDRMIGVIESIWGEMSLCNDDMSTKSLLVNIDSWCEDLRNIGVGHRSDLEELRSSNDALRGWGNDWVDEACRFEDLLNKATDEIEELEERIKELENEQ
jgi:hypothetical protein